MRSLRIISYSNLRSIAAESIKQFIHSRYIWVPGNWPTATRKSFFNLLGDPLDAIRGDLLDSMVLLSKQTISGILFAFEDAYPGCELCPHRKTLRHPDLKKLQKIFPRTLDTYLLLCYIYYVLHTTYNILHRRR